MYLAWYQVTSFYLLLISFIYSPSFYGLGAVCPSFLRAALLYSIPLLVTYHLEETAGLEVMPTQDLRAVSF